MTENFSLKQEDYHFIINSPLRYNVIATQKR